MAFAVYLLKSEICENVFLWSITSFLPICGILFHWFSNDMCYFTNYTWNIFTNNGNCGNELACERILHMYNVFEILCATVSVLTLVQSPIILLWYLYLYIVYILVRTIHAMVDTLRAIWQWQQMASFTKFNEWNLHKVARRIFCFKPNCPR